MLNADLATPYNEPFNQQFKKRQSSVEGKNLAGVGSFNSQRNPTSTLLHYLPTDSDAPH